MHAVRMRARISRQLLTAFADHCTSPGSHRFPLSSMMTPLARHSHAYAAVPKLMPPPLKDTVDTFLDFAKALQAPQDFEETTKLAQKFLASGEGEKLHSLLVERAEELPNWLTPWWLNVAYLEARSPLPIVTSPGVAFPPLDYTGFNGQIDAAARLIQASLVFHHKIINDDLKQDRAGNVPFDMGQYKYLFGTTRVPHLHKDEILYGEDTPGGFAKHILVTRHGHTFHVPVYDTAGNILGTDALVAQLKAVVEQSDTRNPAPINVVSSDDRDAWAVVYDRLRAKNPEAIQSHEQALFVVGLDDPPASRPQGKASTTEQMRQALTGGNVGENSGNRWFDKTINLNVGPEGCVSLTYEHTPAEAPPVATYLEFVAGEWDKKNHVKDTGNPPLEKPHRLVFDLEAVDLMAFDKAAQRLAAATDDLEIQFLPFQNFGKNVPKRARLSPDGFVQSALQVTYYRLHGTLAPTYETATLRAFHLGRTDTIRMPNLASAAFTKAFVDERENHSAEALVKLLQGSVAAHKAYSSRAMSGRGIDRHLLGLRLIAAENSLPAPTLTSGSAYQRMAHFLLSTSQVPTRLIVPLGFGPSSDDCYGICYNPQETAFYVTLTAYNSCKQTSAKAFADGLAETFVDFQRLLEDVGLGTRAKL